MRFSKRDKRENQRVESMQVIQENVEFIEKNKECSYFENEVSDIRYKYLSSCDDLEYLNMLKHGWRRFGHMHFVPECQGCTKCISMRIDVKNYEFTRSQKRVIKKNANTKIYIQPPSISLDHLRLYDKYHFEMHQKKQWPYSSITPSEYQRSYVDGNLKEAREILYVRDDQLIGVALSDILPQAISSIYCYYDHDFDSLSIGRFSILAQIKMAKALNIPYIYLGYWIKDHLSMGYKKEYSPFEILHNRAALNQDAIWKPYDI